VFDDSNVVIDEVVGMDLGDKQSHICVLLKMGGEIIEESRVPTTKEAMKRRFSTARPQRIALEAGTHSPWVSEELERMGHEVIVANPRRLRLIYENRRKNDKVDARYLAQIARMDPRLLAPLCHRGREARADLGLLRSRDALVKSRTKLVNHVRGVVKSMGGRLPSCSTESFRSKRMAPEIQESLKPALLPLLEVIDDLTAKIRAFDRQVEKLIADQYPVAQHLMAINGVGPVTALTFVLTIEDPERFDKSRRVGAYLGLTAGSDDSGNSTPQKPITKQGDAFLRKILVNAANYIIGHFGKDCDLRRHGLKIAARGGKAAKKRAAVAVARKLAVLMHRLWMTGEVYDPFRNTADGDRPATDA
jgi:transposase